jgi:MYXO-CTERM domain-containing protein
MAVALSSAGPAHAYDALAAPCTSDVQTCQIAAIAFSHKNALPIEFSFDTGWTPPNSPVQVHLWAGIYASTHVSLAGSLKSTWPEALVLATPGDKDGGELGYHYGAEIGAQGKVEIEVAGKKYSWVGDLPYVPQFDFQVEASGVFDAWGFPPGITLASKTDPQTLAQIGIGDIIGGSIPGIDGGFQLDVAMELEVTYQTDRIVIETKDGKLVKGGAINSDDGETSVEYLNGPSIELDVHPEGTVDYTGVLHMIPAFYVELLGNTWSIPIADIPIAFPITKNDWIFEKQRVHVPLPDLVVTEETIDFGEVQVGQKNLETFGLWNAGEAKVFAAILSSNPDVFEAFDPTAEVDPSATFDTAIRFVPKKNGEVKATIYVGSNDPSHPVQILTVRGVGYGGPENAPSTDPSQDAGCACAVAGDDGGAGGEAAALPFAAIAVGAAAMRRRRRGRR